MKMRQTHGILAQCFYFSPFFRGKDGKQEGKRHKKEAKKDAKGNKGGKGNDRRMPVLLSDANYKGERGHDGRGKKQKWRRAPATAKLQRHTG